ncbi:DMT family transporter [Microbacterium sp. LWO12-1.2]|uniref:DMT family transporter n=1 Tax=Microbacterium sp. LWO12-1.2 TaxID=3135261 RepID=UPI003430C98D
MRKVDRKFPVWFALLGSGVAGVLVAVQSQSNAALSGEIGDGYLASSISFCSGMLVMLTLLLFSARSRQSLRRVHAQVRAGVLPVWTLTGGACGAFFVLGQGLAAPATGLALFTVGIVGGQVLGGLLIDRIGIGPGGVVMPSLQRIIGMVLAVGAVAISVLTDPGSFDAVGRQAWLILIPIAAGIAVAWQSAVNGRLRIAADSATTATTVNFAVGSAVLLIAAIVSVSLHGWPQHWPGSPAYYIGGFVGTLFIGLAAIFVRTVGVLLLSMSNVAGQLLAAIVFESALPLAGGSTPGLLGGVAVALCAVTIAALPRRTAR